MRRPGLRLVALGLSFGLLLAALPAPPSALAETTPPPGETTPTPTPTPTPVPAPPADPIRVGLGRSQISAEVKAPAGLSVVADGAVQLQTAAGQTLRLDLVQGQIQVAGVAKRFAGPVRLVPITPAPAAGATPPVPPPAPANPVSYAGRAYRGEIEVLVTKKDAKFSIVNVVNFEEYLLAVVPAEMPSTWHPEALKAQAVASRTFARYNMGKGKYPDEGFNVQNNTSDQEYDGLAGEKAAASQAVTATAGQVLTYNGAVANTMYHSSSGGHTENNQIIYSGGTLVPYLQGVEDYDNVPGNRNYAWKYFYTPEEFKKKLIAGGYDVGDVVTVAAAGTPGSSGRPSQWRVIGMKLSALLTGERLRAVLSLPSSTRTVTTLPGGAVPAARTYAGSQVVSVIGADSVVRQRTAAGTVVRGAAGPAAPAVGSLVTRGATIQLQGGFEVAGGGSGHAVGMSQWGAYGMALQGKTYVEILTHYYQGTKVETK